MDESIVAAITAKIAPQGCIERREAEAGYPRRQLTPGAQLTRIAPSPTGFVHVGTVYAALINERIAHQSGGLFLLRVEDTDKSREVEGGVELITDALKHFTLTYDEGPAVGGLYGPYIQSQRAPLYTSFALDLLKKNRAYPCFATEQELKDMRQQQTTAKVRPGYYGQYALWRDKSAADIKTALDAGLPFVLRLRSAGDHNKRFTFKDDLKGDIELPQNDLDVPLIKSDGLPTYHLAHVLDDYLMGTTLVLRGDEWLSSVPLHIDLAAALDIPKHTYGHIAPISISDNGAKRKLSKRKDAEADINTWLQVGYPIQAIIEYLLRLASSDFEEWRGKNPNTDWRDFKLTLEKLSMSRAPLLDMKKLDDVARDVIANMDQNDFENQLRAWTAANDYELSQAFAVDSAYTSKVLKIEREGANRRKDLSKWSDGHTMYAYFFDELFQNIISAAKESELPGLDFVDEHAVGEAFLAAYDQNDDQPTWLTKFRAAAEQAGYCPDMKTYKQNQANYKGSIADFARIIRIKLTGRNQSPDLFLITQTMGLERVKRRLSA